MVDFNKIKCPFCCESLRIIRDDRTTVNRDYEERVLSLMCRSCDTRVIHRSELDGKE